jgi:hypothetical protein
MTSLQQRMAVPLVMWPAHTATSAVVDDRLRAGHQESCRMRQALNCGLHALTGVLTHHEHTSSVYGLADAATERAVLVHSIVM